MSIVQFNTLTHTRHGAMLVHRHDLYVGRALQLFGEFSPGEVDIFKRYLRPGMVAVDAGANIGALTIPMARIVGGESGSQGCVIAIEPQRLTFQALTANVANNSLPNVWTQHAALGAEEGVVRVPQINLLQPAQVGGLALGKYEEGAIVPVIPLDSLIGDYCHFAKIDVEGMERQVIAGARETIAKCRPVLYLENDKEPHVQPLIEDIRQLGYRMWWHRPPLFVQDNFKRCTENPWEATLVSCNMLCLPVERTDTPNDLEEVA